MERDSLQSGGAHGNASALTRTLAEGTKSEGSGCLGLGVFTLMRLVLPACVSHLCRGPVFAANGVSRGSALLSVRECAGHGVGLGAKRGF